MVGAQTSRTEGLKKETRDENRAYEREREREREREKEKESERYTHIHRRKLSCASCRGITNEIRVSRLTSLITTFALVLNFTSHPSSLQKYESVPRAGHRCS